MNRRIFLRNSALVGFSFVLPRLSHGFAGRLNQTIRLGVITDLHQDIMHDGYSRMERFVKEVKKSKPDAIVQLGDFAYPKPENAAVIDLFNTANANALHVIGNHDTDAGYTKEQCLEKWGMPSPYYSKEVRGLKLIVLDCSEKGSATHTGGYVSFVGSAQMNWLKEELEATELPVLIISHQPLAGIIAVDNAKEIQSLLSQYADKILMCMNGHSHIDQHLLIDNINYLHINSASYYWVGGDYEHESYGEEILKEHPWIAMTCPYEECLFAFLTLDPASKTVTVKGRKSKWVGKSPEQLGYKIQASPKLLDWVMPEIKNRKIS